MFNLDEINRTYEALPPEEILKWAIEREFREEVALSSSFGIGSAVLLHMISRIDPGLKVIFVNTGCHFKETLQYREQLVSLLKLTNVVEYAPAEKDLDLFDPDRNLYEKHHDLCCAIRKVEPIKRSLKGLKAWISGIMRSQARTRRDAHMVEAYEGGLFKINPLINWTSRDSFYYMEENNLPHHPLFEKGYPSVGCEPCTFLPTNKNDERSGRWKGVSKTECGLHTFMEKKPLKES
ncbi:MAG: phosphoadenylyl-sulfate reductase [Deltaproteobacteria bacterium]|nr:phosphoadenylyl-sulfate reductase [Deltaproteobacteria bacterium]